MTQKKQTAGFRKDARLLFTGFSMGIADLVPGVSGGTIAFLYGIYDELLFSIKQATGVFLSLLFKGKMREAFQALPLRFLGLLFAGIATAAFGFAGLVTHMLGNYPTLIWSLFFGFVLGSAAIIKKRVMRWDWTRIMLLLAGALITYAVIGISQLNFAPTPLAIFLTGAVAFCAMILPGISGSLIMVILGQYQHVIEAISERNFALLIYLAAGGAMGLALFARLLSWLLRHYHGNVMAFLIGMLLGSLRKVWPWQAAHADLATMVNILPEPNMQLLASIILGIMGFLLVWHLEKLDIASEHDDISTKKFKEEIAHQENL
ncbi:MAG: DUF368 domain-containing protein [Patescibacteria group bacterium]